MNEEEKKLYAIKFKTLPEFVGKYEGNIINLIDKIQRSKDSIDSDYKAYKSIFDDPLKFILLTVIYKWKLDLDQPNANYLFFPSKLVQNIYPEEDKNQILREARKYEEWINKELKNFLSSQQAKEIDNYNPSRTEIIKITRNNIKIDVEYKEDIFELFDNLQTNIFFPFATLSNFYKLYETFNETLPFKTPIPWLYNKENGRPISRSNAIIGNVANVNHTKLLKSNVFLPKNYSAIMTEINEGKINFIISTSVDSRDSEETIIDRILTSFKLFEVLKLKAYNKEQYSIQGEFYKLNYQIDENIFNHLVLNHPIVSQYLVVNENIVFGAKSSLRLHFWFNFKQQQGKRSPISDVKFSIVNHISTGHQPSPKLQQGIPYVRFFIYRVKDSKQAEEFRNLFSRIIKIYEDEYDKLVDLYQQFVPNLDVKKIQKEINFQEQNKYSHILSCEEQLDQEINPKEYAPGIYLDARSGCNPPKRRPCFVDLNDTKKFGSAIKFMKKHKSYSLKFPLFDHPKQFDYVCMNERWPYPGLRPNKTANKNEFPCLPCCYEDNQLNTKKFKQCLEGKQPVKETVVFDKSIGTDKILDENRDGILRYDIDLFFKSIDYESHYQRKGVFSGPSSILDTLNFITSKNKSNLEIRQDLIKMLKQQPQLNVQYENLSAQNHLLTILENTNNFIDPKLFFGILQEYYQINIYIFSRLTPDSSGILDCPYHYYYLLESEMQKDYSCFIYMHIGAESDVTKHIQSEAIVKKDEGKVIARFYSRGSVVKQVKNAFKSMYSTENCNVSFKHKIKSQYVDYFGKTRMLEFEGGINIYTSPLPPLNKIPINNKIILEESNDIKKVLEFIKKEEIYSYFPIFDFNKNIISVNFSANNIFLTAPVIATQKADEKSSTFISTKYSSINNNDQKQIMQLDKYKFYKFVSKIMLEYMFYLFSKLYNYDKNSIYNDILTFFEKNFVIKENQTYTKVPRYFQDKNSFINNNQLIVPDEKIVEKLKYSLLLKAKTDYIGLGLYRHKKYISNYYSDPSEFIFHPKELIIYGLDSMLKQIKYEKPDYNIYQTIINTDKIYYLQDKNINKLIGVDKSQIYFAQKVNNIDQGLEVIKQWNENKINISSHMISEDNKVNNIEFTHSFNVICCYNEQNIYYLHRWSISNDSSNKYNLLQYKINKDTIVTISLLSIN